jgi:hypothetical protein
MSAREIAGKSGKVIGVYSDDTILPNLKFPFTFPTLAWAAGWNLVFGARDEIALSGRIR